ncbi:uncharacterized protein LOC117182650 [Belonocnema kinseyi]|uniref:uncharacterized protein LOC117182650 n=1 Tax=Belonocnema kinseyi TaxID=2817044 RepID=UPI00143D6435|nr:uncharacterized protein LOC117182650 [Belonocnema kinseyi]
MDDPLQHRAVVKEDSLTTRVRIVFDGSAKTLTEISLNETLMVGPTIHDDIFSLILRFRQHQYVLTGDIEKICRQFLTLSSSIFSSPILQQLARDYAKQYPKASQVLLNDIYVDDLITGFKTIKEAKEAQEEISDLLKEEGLNLRQLASNIPQVLVGIALENINQRLQLTDDKTLKTLGIVWNSKSDTIPYTVKTITPKNCVTKRTILSEVATIFDPLGLLGPVILKAKSIIQKLWVAKVDWDESIPICIHTSWVEFCIQLPQINQITFKRKIIIDNPIDNQIHGFCDASETGYGACIYIRSVDAFDQSQVNLRCSRSRVALLKTISLPRLELCGAYTLMSLYNAVKQAINISVSKKILWTDSAITLQWVNTEPHTLKTFVSNRVAAHALSRGQKPGEFIRNVMWQHDPDWLKGPELTWPMNSIPACTEDFEIKRATCLTMSLEMYPFEKFNSLIKLARVFTLCFRFIDSLKHRNSTLGSADAKS